MAMAIYNIANHFCNKCRLGIRTGSIEPCIDFNGCLVH